jgi:hypothetical protein
MNQDHMREHIVTGVPFIATHRTQKEGTPVQRLFKHDDGRYGDAPRPGESFRAPIFVDDKGYQVKAVRGNRMEKLLGAVIAVPRRNAPKAEKLQSVERHAANVQIHANEERMVPAIVTEEGIIPLDQYVPPPPPDVEEDGDKVFFTNEVALAILRASLLPDVSMPFTYAETPRGDSADLMPHRSESGRRVLRVCVRNQRSKETEMYFVELPDKIAFPVYSKANEDELRGIAAANS